jgi:hypothetical protein
VRGAEGRWERGARDGWLKMLGIKAESWDGLKQWIAKNWGIVVDSAVRRLGEEVRSELEALRNKLNDDKVAREAVAPALLLIQAERLGVNETTLRYFTAVASGAVGGDGYVSAALKKVELASGKRAVARLWTVTLAAYGIKAGMKGAGRGSTRWHRAAARLGWLAYTSATVLHCLKETIGLRTTSWMRP